MAEDTRRIPVAPERLSLLRSAVTLASEGAFQEARRLLDNLGGDELGEVERVIRSLISDYELLVDQSAASIEEFAAARRELQSKIDTIEEQRAAIQRLSAPIIDVGDSVVTVPLIGVFDSARTQDLTERLLDRIQQMRVAWVILDLTGADVVDPGTAEHLVTLASAVRLMGATCLVSGLPARVAQALASLETPLRGLRSISSLKEALDICRTRSRAAAPVHPR